MEKDSGVRAIGRGLAVLKVINRHGSLNMMSIAKLSAMPYPTACRIVDTLIEEGMIEREPSRKFYRPTPLVKTLSHGYRPEDDLASASKAPINELTKRILWPVSVCSRVGTAMMIRESSHKVSPNILNMYYPGYTIPILECSAGMAYLAFCGEEERATVLRGLAQSSECGGRYSQQSLAKSFDEIRESGFSHLARCHHTANPGKTSSLSMPITVGDVCEGTVTLVFFSSAMSTTKAIGEFLEPLRAVSETIARSLRRDGPALS